MNNKNSKNNRGGVHMKTFTKMFVLSCWCLLTISFAKETLEEIKANENRVSMTPYNIKTLVGDGHRVLIQTAAGMRSGFSDDEYVK